MMNPERWFSRVSEETLQFFPGSSAAGHMSHRSYNYEINCQGGSSLSLFCKEASMVLSTALAPIGKLLVD